MATFIIDAENSITALGSQQELADLATKWPANRLVEIWNSIPGLTPVKKFTDRKSAVSRIWKAIQSLEGGGATEAAMTAPERANKPKAGGKKGKKANGATKARAAKHRGSSTQHRARFGAQSKNSPAARPRTRLAS
jgi:hypothetical protein